MTIFIQSNRIYSLMIVLFACFISATTLAVDNPSNNEAVDSIVEMAEAFDVLGRLEPRVRTKDLVGFVTKLELPKEQDKVAKQHLLSFSKEVTELELDAAELFNKVWLSKLTESNHDALKMFGLAGSQKFYRNAAKCQKQVVRKFADHLNEFLLELHLQLDVDDDIWNRSLLWLRRQRILRGDRNYSERDLGSLPDLVDQFDRFMREDATFLRLAKPTSSTDSDALDAIQNILDIWALRTDEYVDTYLHKKIDRKLERFLNGLSPTQKTTLTTKRKSSREDFARRYRIVWSTSELIATMLEPTVGAWATERWRRATELVIFPESCPLNSFEHVYQSIVRSGSLSNEDEDRLQGILLSRQKKLAKLRLSMHNASLWYADNLKLKGEGYDVPTLTFNVSDVNKQYRTTIDEMIDIVAVEMPNNDWEVIRERIEKSRNESNVDRYMTQLHEIAVIIYGNE